MAPLLFSLPRPAPVLRPARRPSGCSFPCPLAGLGGPDALPRSPRATAFGLLKGVEDDSDVKSLLPVPLLPSCLPPPHGDPRQRKFAPDGQGGGPGQTSGASVGVWSMLVSARSRRSGKFSSRSSSPGILGAWRRPCRLSLPPFCPRQLPCRSLPSAFGADRAALTWRFPSVV